MAAEYSKAAAGAASHPIGIAARKPPDMRSARWSGASVECQELFALPRAASRHLPSLHSTEARVRKLILVVLLPSPSTYDTRPRRHPQRPAKSRAARGGKRSRYRRCRATRPRRRQRDLREVRVSSERWQLLRRLIAVATDITPALLPHKIAWLWGGGARLGKGAPDHAAHHRRAMAVEWHRPKALRGDGHAADCCCCC